MTYFNYFTNPFNLNKGRISKTLPQNQTIWQIVNTQKIDLSRPVICFVNGVAKLRKDWSIKKYADIIEKRFDGTWFTKETALEENIKNLELCKQNNCCYILIDDRYDVDIEINRPETFSVVP